jgi:hypothetical protein
MAGTLPHRAGCCGGGAARGGPLRGAGHPRQTSERTTTVPARLTRATLSWGRTCAAHRRLRLTVPGSAPCQGQHRAGVSTVPGSARRPKEACRSSSDGLPSSEVFSGPGLRKSWIRAECAERLSAGPISKAATIATRNQAARPIGTHHHGFTLPPRGYLPCSHVLSHRVTSWSRLAIPAPAPSGPGETCRSFQVGAGAPDALIHCRPAAFRACEQWPRTGPTHSPATTATRNQAAMPTGISQRLISVPPTPVTRSNHVINIPVTWPDIRK